MVLRVSAYSPYTSFTAAYICIGVFFKINNEILPPHVVSGVTKEVRSLVYSTSLQFRPNVLHVFAQHEIENVRNTARHNVTMWNFADIFFGTSTFQSCVSSLQYQHSHVVSVKFPTAQISIGLYAYTFMQNVRTGILFALSGWFLTGDVTNSRLHATFFTFSIRWWCSRLVMGLASLLKTQPLYEI